MNSFRFFAGTLFKSFRDELVFRSSRIFVRNINNKCCLFTKVHRKNFLRQYPAVVVQPDGSTYTIRYHEPVGIIKLPPNLEEMSEEERRAFLQKRKVRPVFKSEVNKLNNSFQKSRYLKILKKQ